MKACEQCEQRAIDAENKVNELQALLDEKTQELKTQQEEFDQKLAKSSNENAELMKKYVRLRHIVRLMKTKATDIERCNSSLIKLTDLALNKD